MRARRGILTNERGGAGASATVAIAVLAAFVFVVVQLAPIYWDHYNLEDEIKTKIQFAFVNYSSDEIKKNLTTEIEKSLDAIGADYKKKDIRVSVNNKRKKITVEVWYSRPHKVPFYPPNPKQFYIKLENTPI